MDFSPDNLKLLILSPTESLDVELKRWLNLDLPEDKAKLVKACLALRNNNGGCLIVGFQNDGRPDPNALPNVRAAYHVDLVQELVAKYSFHLFEVKVAFVERDGVEYPVICVPGGIETPVAVKSQLLDDNGKCLIHNDDVYVRSLHSNNRVSSTRARAADWERIARLCFDNREADIGAFIRRHLSGINFEQLASFFRPAKPLPNPIGQAIDLLQFGRQRFDAVEAERNNSLSTAGTREVGAVINGDVPSFSPDEDFLNRLLLTMPHHTGWPPWVDSRNGPENTRPYVFENGWEAYILTALMGVSLDFWRIEPSGRFYHIRAFEDDMPYPEGRKPKPNTELDFFLQVSRVSEAMSNVLSFTRAMGCNMQSNSLAFAFRWRGLKGRHLTSWASPNRNFYSRGASQQDEIKTTVIVPLETALTGLAPFVECVVSPVFSLFGGMKFDSTVIEGIVEQTLQRQF